MDSKVVLDLILSHDCPKERFPDGTICFILTLHCISIELIARLIPTTELEHIEYEVLSIQINDDELSH
jgi:hypothetical protein